MKKSAICITLATLALAGCNNDEKNAQARLDNARSMYEQNEFFAAKNEIDSIRILYPKEFKVIREGLTLMRQVEQKEAERNLAFCDSLIPVKQQELEGLKKGFNSKRILPITKSAIMSPSNRLSNATSSVVTSALA